MKKIYIIILSFLFGFTTSCSSFLDINNNPNTADETVPTPDLRLPPIIVNLMDGYGSGGTRCGYLTQQIGFMDYPSRYYRVGNQWKQSAGDMNWPWQSWYIFTAVNIKPTIEKSQKEEAYHYEGAALFLKAYGFSAMANMFGSVVYDDFATETITPSYQSADYVYNKCIEDIDQAIVLLSKSQPATATPFAKGDILFKGDVQKWIKACYGLKARLLNHFSGATDFNPQAVLDALNNAAQSNDDNMYLQYINNPADLTADKEAIQYTNLRTSGLMGYLQDKYLNNTFIGGSHITDPRADTLMPRNLLGTGRVKGVDMSSQNYHLPNYVNSPIEDGEYFATSYGRGGNSYDYACYAGTTFYTRRDSKAYLMPYHELCLIKAEVLFNKGDKPGALIALKAGMRANMLELGVDAAKIDAFLLSAAVPQTVGELTLSSIMREKFISCVYTLEPWTDMRRYNFDTNIFPDFRPPHTSLIWSELPANYRPHRFVPATYETSYNSAKLLEAEPDYASPGYTAKPIFPSMR